MSTDPLDSFDLQVPQRPVEQEEGRHNILVPLKPRRSNLRDLAVAWMTQALQGEAPPP